MATARTQWILELADKVSAPVKKMQAQTGAATNKANELNGHIQKTQRETGDLKRHVQNLNPSTKVFGNLSGSTNTFRGHLNQAGSTGKKVMNNLQGGATQANKKLKQVDSTGSNLTRTLKRLGGVIAGAFAVQQIGQFASKSMTMYNQQAKAEAMLLTALNGRKSAQEDLIQQAQRLQDQTLFGDEETIKAQSMLSSLNLQEEQIKQLTPVVQDFAAEQNIGLKQAAQRVQRVIGNGSKAFSKYGAELESSASDAENANIIIEKMGDTLEGTAEAALAGTGKIEQQGNAWGDVREQIGKVMVLAREEFLPVVDQMITAVARGVNSFDTESIKAFFSGLSSGVQSVFSFIQKGFKKVTPFVTQFMNALYSLWEPVKGLIKSVWNLISVIWDLLSGIWQSYDATVAWKTQLSIVTGVIKRVINVASSLIDIIATNFKWLKWVAGAWGVYTAVSNAATIATWVSTAATGALSTAMGILNATILANPIAWAIGLLAGLVATVIWAYQEFDAFRGTVTGLWDAFVQVFVNIGKLITNFVDKTLGPFIEAWNQVSAGNFGAAAKALGKGLINTSPAGMAANLMGELGTLTEGVSDAFNKGYEDGAKQVEEENAEKSDQAEKQREPASPTDMPFELGFMGRDQRQQQPDIPGGSNDGDGTASGGTENQGGSITGTGSGSGKAKSITMNLDITQHFNVSGDQDIRDIADHIVGQINDRLRDAVVAQG